MFLGCSDGSDCGGVFEERAQMTKLGLASPWLPAAGVPGLPARVLPLAAPSQSLLHTAATATSPAPIRSYQPPCLPAAPPISMRSRIPPPQCSAPSHLVTQALRTTLHTGSPDTPSPRPSRPLRLPGSAELFPPVLTGLVLPPHSALRSVPSPQCPSLTF